MVSRASPLTVLCKKERHENCPRNQGVGEKPGLRGTAFEGKVFPALFTQRYSSEEGSGGDPTGTEPGNPRLAVSSQDNYKSECLLQCVAQSS